MAATQVVVRRSAVALGSAVVIGLAALGVEAFIATKTPRLPEAKPDPGAELRDRSAVWLGDSTVAGVGASTAAKALPSLVTPAADYRLTVLATSGATANDVLERQVTQVERLRPDEVWISVGANDVTGLNSKNDFERSYRMVLDRLPEQTDVTLLGVPDMGSPPLLAQPLRTLSGWRGEQLDRVVRKLATEKGHGYVDIAGGTGPSFRADPKRYFARDRYHPSDAGYALWAQTIREARTARK